MLRLLRTLGWHPLPQDEYRCAYDRWGGSVITHPDILGFIDRQCGLTTRFLGHRGKDGSLDGCIAVWGEYLAGDKEALAKFGVEEQLDFGTPEIILPLSPAFRASIRLRGKHLSALHEGQILNLSGRNRGRSLCLAGAGQEGPSRRTRQKRKNELKHFLDAGGGITGIGDHAPSALADTYLALFQRRWERPHPHAASMPALFEALHPFLRGHVLHMNERPCAFQLLLASASGRHLSVEFVNSGVDPIGKDWSAGSILTWLNLEQARQEAEAKQLDLRYSFGRNSAAYKANWSGEVPLLRTLTW